MYITRLKTLQIHCVFKLVAPLYETRLLQVRNFHMGTYVHSMNVTGFPKPTSYGHYSKEQLLSSMDSSINKE